MNLKKIFHSVTIRLSLKFAVLLTVTMLLLSIIFTLTLGKIIRNQKNQELSKAASLISSSLLNDDDQNIDSTELNLPYYITYIVYNPEEEADGGKKVLFTNDPFLPLLPVTDDEAEHYIQKDYYFDGDLNILYHGEELELSGKKVIIITAENMDIDSSAKIVTELPRLSLISFFPILIFSFLIALLIIKRTMHPVIKMTESAKEISSSNLDKRLPVSGKKDELDDLAQTFNDLFSQIETDFKRERQFTSDVSHELKTPVAVISGQANLIRRWGKNDSEQLEKSISTIISETKSMDAIIQNLLQMSRLESGRLVPQKEKINLKEMFLKIREEIFSINQKAKIIFSEEKDFSVMADPELLHQVFMVLISNSLKFCPENVEISAFFTRNDSFSVIQIEDNGQGFGDENIPHVFERFYRGDEAHTRSKGGSGLGLSIARTIIESMDGNISAYKAENGGAGIKIELP